MRSLVAVQMNAALTRFPHSTRRQLSVRSPPARTARCNRPGSWNNTYCLACAKARRARVPLVLWSGAWSGERYIEVIGFNSTFVFPWGDPSGFNHLKLLIIAIADQCFFIQRWASRWDLGCVKSCPEARGSQEVWFTQPRTNLLAHLCSSNPTRSTGSSSRAIEIGEGTRLFLYWPPRNLVINSAKMEGTVASLRLHSRSFLPYSYFHLWSPWVRILCPVSYGISEDIS